jgi:hypothetical protein
MRFHLRLNFFVDAAELVLNALDLLPRSLRLPGIQLRSSGARQPPLRAGHNRQRHLQIA